MNDIRIIQGRYVTPDAAMALRLAGYRPGPSWDKAMSMCQRLIQTVRRSIQAKAALAFVQMPNGEQRLYVIMTLGSVVSRQEQLYFRDGHEAEGVLFSALADSCLFAFEKDLLSQIRMICQEKGLGIAQRHEAGVDVPLSVQKDAIQAVAAGRTLGVTVSKEQVLMPLKSMCLIFDLTDDKDMFRMEHDCAACPHLNCSMRSEVPPAGQQVTCPAGTNILTYLQDHSIPLPAHCGGKGICGMCRIFVCQGTVPVSSEDQAFFSAEEIDQGWRLACCDVPETEARIFIPACRDETMAVAGKEQSEILAVSTGIPLHDYGIAIDIGTTTLALALIDMTTGAAISSATAVNSQRVYGADVVSRMAAAGRGCGPGLQHAVRNDLLRAMGRLMADYKAIRPCRIVISANTTMQHLLMGYSCKGLGTWPFQPVSLGGETHSWHTVFAEEMDTIADDCPVTLLPGISAYVGADITSGLWHCHIDRTDGLSLFVDLGTNGEMALGNKKRLLVTSTSAGPALEGGHLSCGVGSVAGAICSVSLKKGKVQIKTINNQSPVGLCGTGVIEGMAALIEGGYVDKTGKLREPYFLHGFPFAQREDDRPIGFTQQDIRDIQMAKGAIRAGMETILCEWGASWDDVGQVYLAGGFGYYLNPQKASAIGLLPKQLVNRTTVVGNTSLAGAVDVLMDGEALAGMKHICAEAKEIILGNTPEFQKLYIHYMDF